jgi:Ca-activated chloride channel family protein
VFEWLQFNSGSFAHFHFLRPWWFLALIPLLLTLRGLWQAGNPMAKWRNIIAPQLLKVMLISHGQNGWFNPVTVSILVVLCGVIALAGPSWKQQSSPLSEDVAALVIVLDASSSMQQEDIQPSRLERAKQKVQDLLALRPGGLVGLVVFAGTAHSVIPLTNDADVVGNFLNAVSTGMMPRKGKFPEKALPLADRMLGDTPVPGTILVIGDGISPQTHSEFQQYFASHPHQLLLLGVGRTRQDSASESASAVAAIPLEHNALEKLALDNGGHYQSLTVNQEDVRRLSRRIDSHLVIVDDGSRPWVDEGYYLVFLVAALMLLWFRKGWTLHWCLVLIMITGLSLPPSVEASSDVKSEWNLVAQFMSWWFTADQQGRYYLQKGDYEKAAARFEDIAWRGVAYYRAENFAAAVEMFSRIETSEGRFNLANAWAHSRNYVLAVRSYNQVLKLEPEHVGAQLNRNRIQKIIDEINLLSATQKAEEGDSSKELGDEPQTAEGVEREDFIQRQVEQLSAEDILRDEQLNELWMRQVQKDPSRFLSTKFHMQLQRQTADE